MNTTRTPRSHPAPRLNGRTIEPTATPCPECAAENLTTIAGGPFMLNRVIEPTPEPGLFCHAHGYVIARAIDEAWGEICDDIASGTLPQLIDNFGDLHDYVDANDYAGFTDPARRASWPTAALIMVQEGVEALMQADRASRLAGTHPESIG
jgi:uncharacterized protein CbrC (UPF0167 family)